MSDRTETKHHVIERSADPQRARTAADILTGGIGFFLPHPEPEKITTITEKSTGITVEGRGVTQDDADRHAYDELRSEKASRR